MAAVPPGTIAQRAALAALTTTPRQPAVTLGGVAFLDDEHPESFPIPWEDQQVVHKLVGGYRQVQPLGIQPEQISWSGTLWDAQAVGKADALVAMAASEQEVALTWGPWTWTVLIAKFTPTALGGRIKYEITCTVVSTTSFSSASATPSIDSQTNALSTSAQQNYSTLAGVPIPPSTVVVPTGLRALLNDVSTALLNAGPLAEAAASDVLAIQSSVTNAISTLTPFLSALTTLMGGYSGTSIPSWLGQAFVAASSISSALTLIGANAQTGQSAATIAVMGGISLWHLASQLCGDATLAPTIQAANGLTSMQLPPGVLVTLNVPPLTPIGLA